MKILQMIRDFEITASGGFAIYVLICVAYVTYKHILAEFLPTHECGGFLRLFRDFR